MGQQIHISLVDLRAACECKLGIDSTPEMETGELTRSFFVLATANDATHTFQLAADTDMLLHLLVNGDASVWADCNYWSDGPDLLAWANQLGVAFRVH